MEWGVANLPRPLASRIRLCNKAALFLFITTALFSIVIDSTYGIEIASIFAVESSLFLLVLLVNRYRFYTVARLLLLSVLCTATYVLSSLLGQFSYIFLFYFAGIAGPFALFLDRERWQQVTAAVLATGLVILDLIVQYHLFSEVDDQQDALAIIRFFTIPCAFIATLLMILSLLRDNQRAEQQAYRNQRKLETIVTSLNEVVYEIDENYRIIDVWASDDSLLPVPRETEGYRSIQTALPPDLYQRFKEMIDEALFVGVTSQLEYRSPNNQRWYQARIVPTNNFDDTGKRVSLSLVDISAEKEAEYRVRMSELRFRSMAENVPGVIVEWCVNRESRRWWFNYVSPQVESLLGLTPDACLGDANHLLDFIYAEDKKAFFRSYHKAASSKSRWLFSFRIKLDNQQTKWVSGVFTPIEHKASLVVYHGILMDVTAAQTYQEELLAAKESAEIATQEKSNFLSVMSHEIRTPLNAVIGLSDLLLQESPRPDQAVNLSTLKFSAESLLALINDILDFSKIEAGKISLEAVPFDLQAMVRGVVTSMDYQAEEKGIQLRCNIDSRVPALVVGDPTRLSQILNNLVSNAVKFTKQGFVEAKVERLRHANSCVSLRFSIIDSGIGIAPDKQQKIFRFFSQADNSVTREFGGTGLGLSITRSLLAFYHSEVTLTSEPGQGSTFQFELTLPVAAVEPRSTGNQPLMKPDIDLHGLRILLVDDNRVNILVAMKLLTRWGADVDMAEDGERAVAMVQQTAYHVILMDIQMPGMDGYQATRAIRSIAGERFKTVPIIALTATVIDEVLRKAERAGLNGVLPKPIRPAVLKQKMASYVPATGFVE